MFENYKESLFRNKVILRSHERFRSYDHKVYTEEVNKIALSSNDDKRLQTIDRITTYLYGMNAFKVCESEMLSKNKTTPKTKTKDKDMTTPESYDHQVYTKDVNKIALSSNDDKRLQTFHKVTTFPYGTNVFKVCESEMLSKNQTTP